MMALLLPLLQPASRRLLCGCKWYHSLSGDAYDWGICGNPKSHGSGLLTFEYQGCPMCEQG